MPIGWEAQRQQGLLSGLFGADSTLTKAVLSEFLRYGPHWLPLVAELVRRMSLVRTSDRPDSAERASLP